MKSNFAEQLVENSSLIQKCVFTSWIEVVPHISWIPKFAEIAMEKALVRLLQKLFHEKNETSVFLFFKRRN